VLLLFLSLVDGQCMQSLLIALFALQHVCVSITYLFRHSVVMIFVKCEGCACVELSADLTGKPFTVVCFVSNFLMTRDNHLVATARIT